MQYVQIKQNTTLNDLRNIVGTSNLESVLAVNSLTRSPNIGAAVIARSNEIIRAAKDVTIDFKKSALSRASQDSDVFETLALSSESGWKVYQATDALEGTLKVPDGISIPYSQNIIGDSVRVPKSIFSQVLADISNPPHSINPEIFTAYYRRPGPKISESVQYNYSNMFQYFKIPWGQMSIYSSIAKEAKDFPVYPEEVADGVKANYQTMPEIIYQYEPWQLYTSSGPRSNSYTFKMHRDMWTGDHRDGKCNELIRFCMANCYPEYNGSAVNSSTVSLYMNGQLLIQGVLTDVSVTWDGPLGLDSYYLVCTVRLNIIEVSPQPLDFWTMRAKPLIG